MSRRFKACRSILLLGVFLTTSQTFGEPARSGPPAPASSAEALEAARASIPRREFELAMRRREDVLAEVKKRMQEMGVKGSAEELTDLLEQRAHLSIAADKCRLDDNAGPGACYGQEAALAEVETAFRRKAGLSTSEFRGGRRQTAEAPLADKLGLRSANAASSNQTCTCTFTVYSLDRWMNQYWGLECNNHASHGVCSNNVDSAHSAGTGAMTGDIDLYFGGHHAHRECPDDQRTCFKGPSTDHPGSWGNACNCDTWHSQYYNPWIAWYGGDLTDSAAVDQLSTGYLSVSGACSENYVSVSEYIKENDPWCCDDPMGTLWVSLPLADGYGTTSGPASYQNCNGGSQSGRYPYCGTFGATIRVAYICSTYTPPPPPVCDPEAEQACYDMGWNWDASTCNCTDPCQPDPYCTEWDHMNCRCYRY